MGIKEIRTNLHLARIAVRRAVRKVLRTSPAKFDHVRRFVQDKRTRWAPDMIPLTRHMYLWYGDKPIGRLGDVPPESPIGGHVYLVAANGEFLAYVVSRSIFVDSTWEEVQQAILKIEDPDRIAYVAHAYQATKPFFSIDRDSYGYFVWKMPLEETPAAWATRHLGQLAIDRAQRRKEDEARDARYKACVDAQHESLYNV